MKNNRYKDLRYSINKFNLKKERVLEMFAESVFEPIDYDKTQCKLNAQPSSFLSHSMQHLRVNMETFKKKLFYIVQELSPCFYFSIFFNKLLEYLKFPVCNVCLYSKHLALA